MTVNAPATTRLVLAIRRRWSFPCLECPGVGKRGDHRDSRNYL